MKTSKAFKKVFKAIRKDEDLYRAYKDNIAMAFKDEFSRKRLKKEYINLRDVHEIANAAADNFLTLLLNGDK